MFRTNCVVTSVCLVIGLATSVTPATASPLTVTFEGVSPAIGNAGQYNWNTGAVHISGILYTPNLNGSSSLNHFVAFCMEQSQNVTAGTTYTGDYAFSNLETSPSPGPVLTASTANDIRAMWAEYRGGLDTADESAAFQHAVWHLVQPSYNPTLGGTVGGYYNTYLTSSSWQSGLANLATLISDSKQDQIFELRRGFVVQNGQITEVPEPATLAVFGGIALAGAFGYRRRKAAATA